jgi:hypothetical protein
MNPSNKKVTFHQDDDSEDESSDKTSIPPSSTDEISPTRVSSETIPFWSEDPNILLRPKYIYELFPSENMTYEQKLNAVTRMILLLMLFGFIMTQSFRLLLVSAVTLGAIFVLHYYHEKERTKVNAKKYDSVEGFGGAGEAAYKKYQNASVPTDVFMKPEPDNPFSNVLMTDYDYNPNKKPAPPAFNENVNSEILQQAKQLVVDANPDQPDIANKLFKDLGEQLVFEQSMRQFTSTPSTTIPNDQGAFADFCYGSMISCKEGNLFSCARNMTRYNNY